VLNCWTDLDTSLKVCSYEVNVCGRLHNPQETKLACCTCSAVCGKHVALGQLQLHGVYYMQQTFRQRSETEDDSTCICDVTSTTVRTHACRPDFAVDLLLSSLRPLSSSARIILVCIATDDRSLNRPRQPTSSLLLLLKSSLSPHNSRLSAACGLTFGRHVRSCTNICQIYR
jgi:hypothetical protein